MVDVWVQRDFWDWVFDAGTAIGTVGATATAVWQTRLAQQRATRAEERAEAVERERAVERAVAQARQVRHHAAYPKDSGPAVDLFWSIDVTVTNGSADFIYDLTADPVPPLTLPDANAPFKLLERIAPGETTSIGGAVLVGSSGLPFADHPRYPSAVIYFTDARSQRWKRSPGGALDPVPPETRMSLEGMGEYWARKGSTA